MSDPAVEIGIPGVEVGHWSDPVARTGCTVVVFPTGTVASGEVRGGAPATRDFALLDPGRTVEHVDAVMLSGGSAFGLSAADGAMAELEAAGRGYPTRAGPVPIVIGLSLYDLGVGDASVRPGPAEGRDAFRARSTEVAIGPVGAGTGATTGTWTGAADPDAGGLGVAVVARDDVRVAVVVAVNAAGHVDDGSPGPVEQIGDGRFDAWPLPPIEPFTNTTIGVVVTNARLDKSRCHLLAQGAHDGLARAVVPAHTTGDGDAFVAAATGPHEAPIDQIRLMAVAGVVRAVRTAVGTIQT